MEVVAYVATQWCDQLVILKAAKTDRTLILTLKSNIPVGNFWQGIYDFVFKGSSLSFIYVGFTDSI